MSDPKRVPLEPGPLSDLVSALHRLREDAGGPSVRDLARDIGGRVTASHTTVHNVFTGSKRPNWRFVEPLVQVMARRANRDGQAEVERIRLLWTKAHPDNALLEPQTNDSTATEESQIAIGGFSRPILDLLADALTEIEAVGSNEAKLAFRIPTGFDDLDALIGGWSQGYLIVVGGRPSSGKTDLLLNFCRAASIRYRLATMFTTGEMNSREIHTRMVSAEARVPLHILRTGQMNDDDWGRVANQIKFMAESPIHIDTTPGFKMEHLIADVNRLVREAGLKLLLIDGLQWMTGGEDETSPRIVESTLRRLKKLAETAKIAIIVTAHAGIRSGWASMAAFTHSAAIEQVSDVVILLERPDQDDLESPYAGEANLIVAKNRNGPTAMVTVACQLHYCRFVDMAPGSGYVSTPISGL